MTDPRHPASAPFVGVKGAKAPDYPPNYVTIYNVETGEAVKTKPINAREAVEGGHWSWATVTAKGAKAAKDPEARGNREKELKSLSAEEVKEIATAGGIEYTNKADAIDQILASEFPK